MVSIDLGEVSDRPPPLPPAPPISPGVRRLVALLGCLLLLGGLAVSSAGPASDGLREVRVPADVKDVFFRDGDRLYVVGPSEYGYTADDPPTITAYTVPGGERLWERKLRIESPVHGMTFVGDTMLLMLIDHENRQVLVAVDAETAEERWRSEGGRPIRLDDDAILFTVGPESSERPVVWQAVRAATGEKLWRRELPPGSFTQELDGTGRMLVTTESRTVQVQDLPSGRVLASAEMPRTADVLLFRDQVLAVTTGIEHSEVAAYSLSDLRQTWRRDFPGMMQYAGCGETVICVSSLNQDRHVALDPATGTELWNQNRYAWFAQLGDLLVADGLIRGDGATAVVDPGGLVVFEPRTGQVIKDFGRWRRIQWEESSEATHTAVVQYDETDGTALVGDLDLRAMAIRVLGAVHGVGQDCLAEGTVMTCRFQDGAVGMWDLAG